MMALLRAEFRKLLSVRSTYAISVVALLLVGFFAFYGSGYKGGPDFPPEALQSIAMVAVSIVGGFAGIVAILLISHEYRYNTIFYTLAASNSRLQVLLAKLLVGAVYALLMTFITIVLAILLTKLGAGLAGHDMGPQTIEVYDLLWRSVAYMLASVWLGLALGFLLRSVVAAIVVYFLIPTIEPLFHTLLKISNNYLPSASQSQILATAPTEGVFSPLAAAGVFALYLLVAWIIAGILFVRRDAN